MRFIANGDYIMPLHAVQYWSDQLYMWSFQRGAANPDGILRLPGRFIDMLVFAACGNLVTSYFFLLSSLAVSFVSFWWFARVFLGVERWAVAVLGALLYTCNPIFLGNLSKVGLILAVSMLPVMLAAIKQGFTHRRFSYFLLYIVALNISLIHPFTFTVNVLVSGLYFAFSVRRARVFVKDNIWKFVVVAAVGFLLNAYAILPIASLGTLDKSALSSTVSSTPVDYTKLVDIANTGDIFTGLSLSKGVLKDYEFYGARSWPFYFLGVFVFYALLFGTYIRVEKRAKPAERQRFVIAIGLFLVLLALSTASFLRADLLLKFLIGLPGGWMFRSPLKWQLYMPVLIIAALVIALKYVRSGWRFKILYAALGISFVLMNGYLFTQIYHRLLTPRPFTYFSALNNLDLEHKNILFADADSCLMYARDHPVVATELNEVFISQMVQVKHVEASDLDTVAASHYDYVMGCKSALSSEMLTKQYDFTQVSAYADNTYILFKNTYPDHYVSTVNQPLLLPETSGLSGKYSLVTRQLEQPFNFLLGAKTEGQGVGVQDIFDGLSTDMIKDGILVSRIKPVVPGTQQIFVNHTQPLYANSQGAKIELSTAAGEGTLVSGDVPLTVDVPSGKTLDFSYRDPKFNYKNIIANPSLESGLWQKEVGDCNAYDDKPILSMNLDKQASDGKQSLQLAARQHIACTGPTDVAIKAGEHYLLSFDYQTPGDYAGYFVSFDDKAGQTFSKRLDKTPGWQAFNTELTVPDGAQHLHLVVYAYPDGSPGRSGVASYDNFKLIRIPDIGGAFFAVGGAPDTDAKTPGISYTILNPTKTTVHVSGANKPFYLSTKESYHQLWRLSLDNGAQGLGGLFASKQTIGTHVQMNGVFNGWYIDPATACAQEKTGCHKNPDGGYDMDIVMEFQPQRSFYIGGLISLVTAVGVAVYIAQDLWRHRRKGQA